LEDRIGAIGEFFVSSVVLGELYYGANKSQRVTDNTARIDDFAVRNVVLGCDTETARGWKTVIAFSEGENLSLVTVQVPAPLN
jgi:tRNA(fMet)-specific endonuclease VapC